jgi:hypothetical protein
MKKSAIFNLPFILPKAAAILAILAFLWPITNASAHGSTTVGDYQIEIGFKNEPALQDQPNGLDLVVTNTKTNKPVTGLEDTLQAEIIFGASKKTMKIEPVEGEDGAYTAFVLPTAVGDYTWHISGKIEDTPVDISMTSSPTTFVSVVPQADASFPGRESSLQQLRTELQRARLIAIVGVVMGGIGLLLGLVALVMALSRGKGISVK